MNRTKKCRFSRKSKDAGKDPEPIRDGIDDLQKRMKELTEEMSVIKKMLESR